MIKQRVKGTRGSIIPLGITIFLGLLFYSIYDLQTVYAKPVGILLLLIYGYIIIWILRYAAISVEYSILGSDLVLKRVIVGYVQKVLTIPFRNIVAIGYGKKIRKLASKRGILDYCATFRGKHVENVIIIYKEEDNQIRKVRFEPQEEMLAYLKKHMTGKFYEH